MLRYLNAGQRNFLEDPVPPLRRVNWEFYIVAYGRAAPFFDTGKAGGDLRSRTLWVFSPQSCYGWRGDQQGCERFVFHFSGVPEVLEAQFNHQPFLSKSLKPSQIAQIRRLFSALAPHFKNPSTLSPVVYQKALCELTLLVLEGQTCARLPTLQNHARQKVERAIAWFELHMARNPTLKDVASAMNLSTSHLRRLFSLHKGESPISIFRQIRLRRAEKLMETGSDKLEVIARQCGFAGASDLCRNFRAHVGTSPTTWRQQTVPFNIHNSANTLAAVAQVLRSHQRSARKSSTSLDTTSTSKELARKK